MKNGSIKLWIVVGLGNPGIKYSATRHNIGFMVLDRLSETHRIPLAIKENYSFGRGTIEDATIILLKPLTYMNLSGTAVRKVLKKFSQIRECQVGNIIVVHDDLDLEAGIVKIRKTGSSGGHKGIDSIIQEIGTKEFIRVKIGIGRESEIPVEEYVLRRFKSSEKKLIEDGIIKAMSAVESIVTEGVEKAMNTFNRTIKKEILQP
jgi:PTH1 family peptidyl-tRNA hydrolase